jgi:hypothetical protein
VRLLPRGLILRAKAAVRMAELRGLRCDELAPGGSPLAGADGRLLEGTRGGGPAKAATAGSGTSPTRWPPAPSRRSRCPRRAQRARPARRLHTRHTRLRPDREPAHRGSPQPPPLAPAGPQEPAQTRETRPCHSQTQRDTAGPGASTQIRSDVLDLRKSRLKTLAHRSRPAQRAPRHPLPIRR